MAIFLFHWFLRPKFKTWLEILPIVFQSYTNSNRASWHAEVYHTEIYASTLHLWIYYLKFYTEISISAIFSCEKVADTRGKNVKHFLNLWHDLFEKRLLTIVQFDPLHVKTKIYRAASIKQVCLLSRWNYAECVHAD